MFSALAVGNVRSNVLGTLVMDLVARAVGMLALKMEAVNFIVYVFDALPHSMKDGLRWCARLDQANRRA